MFIYIKIWGKEWVGSTPNYPRMPDSSSPTGWHGWNTPSGLGIYKPFFATMASLGGWVDPSYVKTPDVWWLVSGLRPEEKKRRFFWRAKNTIKKASCIIFPKKNVFDRSPWNTSDDSMIEILLGFCYSFSLLERSPVSKAQRFVFFHPVFSCEGPLGITRYLKWGANNWSSTFELCHLPWCAGWRQDCC